MSLFWLMTPPLMNLQHTITSQHTCCLKRVWAHLYACFFLRHLLETILLKTQNLYSQSVMLRGFEGIYKAVKVASILVLV